MSVVIRCNKCKKFYAVKSSACIYCGHESRDKKYYVRLGKITTYAGNAIRVAREMDSELKKKARLGNLPAYNKPKNLSFSEFIEKYYTPHYQSLKSAKQMKRMVNFYLKAFHGKTLRAIQPAEIEQLITTHTIGRTPRTRDHYLAIIRKVFNYALELELLERSPVKMKELKVDNSRHRFLSDDEAKRLLEECQKSPSKRLYPMVLIALHTGMRLGEIISLKRENIIDGRIYLQSTHTKNSKVKIIPLNATLKEFITEYLCTHKDFAFGECRYAFNQAVKRAGIIDFRFHDLRHTFASKLKAKNVNDGVIQKLMGLETPAMVQRYAHLAPDSVLNAIEVVEYT
jgi:integrase